MFAKLQALVLACSIFSSLNTENRGEPKFPVPRITHAAPAGGEACRSSQTRASSALLQGYRSLIGKDHFMTKELQRYVEGLRRRKNKRLNSMFQ